MDIRVSKLTLTVSPTTFCSLNCDHCHDSQKSKKTLDFEYFNNTLQAIKNSTLSLEAIVFSGGETLTLKPSFLHAIFKLSRVLFPSCQLFVQSSLFSVPDESLALCLQYAVRIETSFDVTRRFLDSTPVTYMDWNSRYQQVSKKLGYFPNFSITLTKPQLEFDLSQFLDSTHGQASFNLFYPIGSSAIERPASFELQRYFQYWRERAKSLPLEFSYVFRDFSKYDLSGSIPHGLCCSISHELNLKLFETGEIGTCRSTYSLPETRLSAKTTIPPTDLLQYVISTYITDITKRLSYASKGPCSTCDVFARCSGGCHCLRELTGEPCTGLYQFLDKKRDPI